MTTINPVMMRRASALFLALLVTACAHGGRADRPSGPLPTPNPHAKVGNPYRIDGRTYVPRVDPSYDQVGIASWYGPQFHGKLTANGELFDMNRLTAAHQTLPLPSLIRVTNLENGRSAVLRLNDRGPFAGDRILDLSRAAAEQLGTKEQGLGRVRVEYLGAASLDDAIVSLGAPEDFAALHLPMLDRVPDPRPAHNVAASPSSVGAGIIGQAAAVGPQVPVEATYTDDDAIPDGFYVVIGAFGETENVSRVRSSLPPIIPVHVRSVRNGDGAIHQVRLGPYVHAFAAREALRVAQDEGYYDAHIVQRERQP